MPSTSLAGYPLGKAERSWHAKGLERLSTLCLHASYTNSKLVSIAPGSTACSNGEPGDLYVFISTKPHPELRREGVTIHSGATSTQHRLPASPCCDVMHRWAAALQYVAEIIREALIASCCPDGKVLALPLLPVPVHCRCGDLLRGRHPGHYGQGDHTRQQRAVPGGPQNPSRCVRHLVE